jgi:hypothetical protein
MAKFSLYKHLLKLYPDSYRRQYGDQMSQTLTDMLGSAVDGTERRKIWAKAIAELPISITKAQLNYVGGIMQNETPHYVKQAGLAASLLVAPFFLALIANSVDNLLFGHNLYNSWVWNTPVLATWILLLPALALVLSGGSLLRLIVWDRQAGQASLAKRMFDTKHSWPVVLPLVVALGILCLLAFHDSAHCLVGNPVRELRNLHQTRQCITNGFLGGK